MARLEAWTPADVAVAVAMWAAMMVAMMLPSAAPMILVFVGMNRKRRAAGSPPYVDTDLFALGCLVVSSGFSAAAAKWAPHGAAFLEGDAT